MPPTDETSTTPVPDLPAAVEALSDPASHPTNVTAAQVAQSLSDHPEEITEALIQQVQDRIDSGEKLADPNAPMHEVEAHVVGVTVPELKAIIARNPNHRIAEIYANAIRNVKDDQPVYVEQPDLQALLQNLEVETTDRQVDGVRKRFKRITK